MRFRYERVLGGSMLSSVTERDESRSRDMTARWSLVLAFVLFYVRCAEDSTFAELYTVLFTRQSSGDDGLSSVY